MFRQISDDADLLLYVLSTRGEMSWERFKGVFEILYLKIARGSNAERTDSKFQRNRTSRALDALGHCDLSFTEGRGKVFVSPPILARLPQAGLPQAVLAGARLRGMIDYIKEAAFTHGASVRVEPQGRGLLLVPRRVLIEGSKLGDLAGIANTMGITFAPEPPAWGLLHASGTLDDILTACQWRPEMGLNWPRRNFDPERLVWVLDGVEVGRARLASYTDPKRQACRHHLCLDGREALIDRNWGGYAVLRENSYNVLAYDRYQFLMAVPTGAPLPFLLARSLALCSGLAPSFLPALQASWPSPERRGFDIYHKIPPQIAAEVARRLGQSLLQRQISL